jgi:carbon storage regulator
MLVLARRTGQAIHVGDDIEVVVLAVRGDQVRLGVRAPRRVSVVRAELLQEVSSENRAAAQAGRILGDRQEPSAGQRPARPLKSRRAPADIGNDGAAERHSSPSTERRPCPAHIHS